MEHLTPDLIRRAVIDKDSVAIRAVVSHLTPILRARITLTLVRCGGAGRGSIQTDVDDFVQEVFIRLFADGGHRLLSWDSDRGQASTWFSLIAQRVTLDLIRVKRSNPYFEEPTEDSTLEITDPKPTDIGQRMIDRDTLRILGDRLRTELSDRDRLLFELSIVAGEDDDRVRDLLGIGRDALYQARRRLRVRLDRLWQELLETSEGVAKELT